MPRAPLCKDGAPAYVLVAGLRNMRGKRLGKALATALPRLLLYRVCCGVRATGSRFEDMASPIQAQPHAPAARSPELLAEHPTTCRCVRPWFRRSPRSRI